mmetsp:Transcript_98713/g.279103  ORF Transcript_98713/g.279103 Transcript_98713/m.279103 type:complete len:285 (+) Transcript_98713:65-919(+)
MLHGRPIKHGPSALRAELRGETLKCLCRARVRRLVRVHEQRQLPHGRHGIAFHGRGQNLGQCPCSILAQGYGEPHCERVLVGRAQTTAHVLLRRRCADLGLPTHFGAERRQGRRSLPRLRVADVAGVAGALGGGAAAATAAARARCGARILLWRLLALEKISSPLASLVASFPTSHELPPSPLETLVVGDVKVPVAIEDPPLHLSLGDSGGQGVQHEPSRCEVVHEGALFLWFRAFRLGRRRVRVRSFWQRRREVCSIARAGGTHAARGTGACGGGDALSRRGD